MDAACRECTAGLSKAIRARRHSHAKTLPRWLEPSPDFLSFAHTRSQAAGASTRIALHLSNLQGVDFNRFPLAVGPIEGRVLYDAAYRGKKPCEDALRWLAGTDIMIWSPTDNSILAQLAAAIQTLTLCPQNDLIVHLVVPHDPSLTLGATLQNQFWSCGGTASWQTSARVVEKCGILETAHAVLLLRKHGNLHLINEGNFHSYGNDTLAAYSSEA